MQLSRFGIVIYYSTLCIESLLVSILCMNDKSIPPAMLGEGTEKVDGIVYVWYNVNIKYRRCFLWLNSNRDYY